MDIKPILSSLRRSPTGAILVALQIALALAIVVNSLFIIVQRFEKVNRDPGVDVPNIFFAKPADYKKATQSIYRSATQASSVVLPVVK